MGKFILCLMFMIACLSDSSREKHECVGDLGTIHVVLCTDDALGGPVSVLLTSMFENADKDTFYHVHILIPGNFRPEVKVKIGALEEKFKNCKLDFIDMGNTFSNFSGNFPPSSNYYILAASLFPDIKKLLYLDADIIVRHDLSQLYGTDIEGYYFAGVLDPVLSYGNNAKRIRRKIVKTRDLGQYINAGVVLLNLEKIREDRIEDEFLKFMESEKQSINKIGFFMSPQDIINHVCYGKILLLPVTFNLMINRINNSQSYEESAYAKLTTKKYWEDAKDPTIVHFAALPKPWGNDQNRQTVYHEEWKMWLTKTAFYDWKKVGKQTKAKPPFRRRRFRVRKRRKI